MSAREKSDVRGGYRISAVSRLTGVSSHALRVWERRYGAFSSGRSDGGYRLYTDRDVSRIAAIKRLLDEGHPISQLVALSVDELERMHKEENRREMIAPPTGMPSEPVVELARSRFLDAVRAFDLDDAARTIASVSLALEPLELVTQVVGPLLTEVGTAWLEGTLSVAQEHGATSVLRTQLTMLLRGLPRGPDARAIVCTTPEGELHELGAMLAAVVAALQGFRTVYLGPSLPVQEIVDAAKGCDAHAVALSLVAMEPEVARRFLSKIRAALPTRIEILVGGASVRSVPKGVVWTPSLDDLAQRLERLRER